MGTPTINLGQFGAASQNVNPFTSDWSGGDTGPMAGNYTSLFSGLGPNMQAYYNGTSNDGLGQYTIRNQIDPNNFSQSNINVGAGGAISGWTDPSTWQSQRLDNAGWGSQIMSGVKSAAPLALAGFGGMGALGFGPLAGMFGGAGAAGGATADAGTSAAAGGSAAGGMIPGTSLPQFAQLPGYGTQVGGALADASGASPYSMGLGATGGGGGAVADAGTMAGVMGSSGAGAGTDAILGAGAGGGGLAGAASTVANGAKTISPVVNVLRNILSPTPGASGVSNLGNLASLFANYQNSSNLNGMINQVKNIYSPTGPYAQQLQSDLARKDAAAGRNSQYGPRETQFMAQLAGDQAQTLAHLMTGYNNPIQQQAGNTNALIGAGGRLLNNMGGMSGGLASLFGGQGGGMTIDPSGMGIGQTGASQLTPQQMEQLAQTSGSNVPDWLQNYLP